MKGGNGFCEKEMGLKHIYGNANLEISHIIQFHNNTITSTKSLLQKNTTGTVL